MVRLAHVSDIHLTAPTLNWTWRDWFNKRLAAWLNFRWLGRAWRFRHADQVMAALNAELRSLRPDHIVFSGDATALGFDNEIRRAAALLGVGDDGMIPGIAVPGNHDYCTRPAAASGNFERHFAPWQVGLRVDDAVYPFARKVGHVWLVAVNSCTGNRWAWDAGGSVGAAQLDRLRRLLLSLDAGPRILVTHYPVALADGRPERRGHGLRDLRDVLQVAREHRIALWLHGHRHGPYVLRPPEPAPFPIICAGSATQSGLWGYGIYTIEAHHCHVQKRVFDPAAQAFRDAEMIDLELP